MVGPEVAPEVAPKEQKVVEPMATQENLNGGACGKTALPTKGAYMGVIKHKCSGETGL